MCPCRPFLRKRSATLEALALPRFEVSAAQPLGWAYRWYLRRGASRSRAARQIMTSLLLLLLLSCMQCGAARAIGLARVTDFTVPAAMLLTTHASNDTSRKADALTSGEVRSTDAHIVRWEQGSSLCGAVSMPFALPVQRHMRW